jgi:hypothetical protein
MGDRQKVVQSAACNSVGGMGVLVGRGGVVSRMSLGGHAKRVLGLPSQHHAHIAPCCAMLCQSGQSQPSNPGSTRARQDTETPTPCNLFFFLVIFSACLACLPTQALPCPQAGGGPAGAEHNERRRGARAREPSTATWGTWPSAMRRRRPSCGAILKARNRGVGGALRVSGLPASRVVSQGDLAGRASFFGSVH